MDSRGFRRVTRLMGRAFGSGRRRREELRTVCAVLGLAIDTEPDERTRDDAYAPLGTLRNLLRAGAGGVRTVVRGTVDEIDVHALEHAFAFGNTSRPRTVAHAVVYARCPESWPRIGLASETAQSVAGNLLGLRDVQLDNAAFNRRWRVRTDDDEFAIRLLGPELMSFLEVAPKEESWEIGAGVVCCIRRGGLDTETLTAVVRRPVDLLRLVPPKLLEEPAAVA